MQDQVVDTTAGLCVVSLRKGCLWAPSLYSIQDLQEPWKEEAGWVASAVPRVVALTAHTVCSAQGGGTESSNLGTQSELQPQASSPRIPPFYIMVMSA